METYWLLVWRSGVDGQWKAQEFTDPRILNKWHNFQLKFRNTDPTIIEKEREA